MDEWLIVEDKSVQDALTQALIKLELTSDQVEYEILEEEKGGLLGLFSKPAKIRVRKKSEGGAAASGSAASVDSSNTDSASSTVTSEDSVSVKSEQATDKTATSVSSETNTEIADTHESRKKSEITRDVNTITVKAFLDDMFKAMGIEVSVTESYNPGEGQLDVELSGSQMGMMIGKRGQTLDALQYLASLVLNKDHDDYVKVKIDTENYRDRRKATIENLAKNVAKKVKASGRSSTLEPMNPYERRIIHAALQDDKYVKTHSEGEEPHRKVVVSVNPEFADELREKNRNQRDRKRGGYGGRGGNRGGKKPYRGGNRNRRQYDNKDSE